MNGSVAARSNRRKRLERTERAIARLTDQLDQLAGALFFHERSKMMELMAVPLAPMFDRILRENADAARDKTLRCYP
jgi:hypothetical protein